MTDPSDIDNIAHVIQLSVTPVFLLLGIGSMLSVMTSRLGRVIDRARLLEGMLDASAEALPGIEAQLNTLSQRAKLANAAITLFTVTALLICAVIAILFSCAILGWDASGPVALLFIFAMLSLFGGLLLFLREIRVATAGLRIGRR